MLDASSSTSASAAPTGPAANAHGAIADVPHLGAAEVAVLVARARAAQPAWAALGFGGRRAVLQRAKAWVFEHRERLIEAVMTETGKPYEEAQIEVVYLASALDHWSKHAEAFLADETVSSRSPLLAAHRMRIVHQPRGVIGVIGPWNVPLINSVGDCIPALAAGNAVVLKPSEVTPLSALVAQDMLPACGAPADTFLIATGAGEAGAALVDHVDFVHFTGSVETGRKVAHRAIDLMTPYTLELGGKDPMIVFADADLERAANAAVFYGLFNAGQVCVSTERVYVEASVHDRFADLVTEKAAALRQGHADGPKSIDMGPMINAPQAETVRAHIEDAKARGATIRTGGEVWSDDRGTFVQPTVLTGVDHTMDCMREETFGPTLPIMPFADEAEAIALANDSRYGLSASVFTKDAGRGMRVALALDVGSVNVNDAVINYLALEVPMGGAKESGIGVRHSAAGIRKYCTTKVITSRRASLRRDPYWFPYRGTGLRVMNVVHRAFYARPRRKDR